MNERPIVDTRGGGAAPAGSARWRGRLRRPYPLPLALAALLAAATAWAQTAPPIATAFAPRAAEARCEGAFATHLLEHTTVVPGDGVVRGFDANGGGVALGDLDDDGDLDLLVLTLDGPPLLYLNRADVPGRQLLVTLRDGDRPVFGAMMTVTTDAGTQRRQVLSARSFQASPDPRLHFSVADGPCPVTGASVLWPGGEIEALDGADLAFGTRVVVEKGRGVTDVHPLGNEP